MQALELRRLTELETIISDGIQTFVEVGNALKEIRDARLYREQHRTFELYCRERWGFARTYAHYMIESADVVGALRVHHGEHLPTSERQARELSRLKDEQTRAEVWQRVTETHEPTEITAKVIREGVEKEEQKEEQKEQSGEKPYPASDCRVYLVSDAMKFAAIALSQLKRIRKDDPYRSDALLEVEQWIQQHKAEASETRGSRR